MKKIMQWNCRGVKANLTELQFIITALDPVVICLQETLLSQNATITLKGYVTYHNPGPNTSRPSGGTITLVKNNLPHNFIKINSSIQNTTIRVSNITRKTVTICNLYIPPNSNPTFTEYVNLIDQLPTPYLLLGDFNSHNPLWSKTNPNRQGKILEKTINTHNLCILNSEADTYLHPAHGTYSNPDLSISHPGILLDLKWEVLNDQYGSDHFPIILTTTDSTPQTPTAKWNFNKANWETYQLLCQTQLNETFSGITDIMAYTRTLRAIADKTIPKTNTKTKRKKPPWMNEECKQAIQTRKRALRRFSTHPTATNLEQVKITRAKARRIIKQAKKQSWQEFVQNISINTSMTKIWGMIKRMEKKQDQPRIHFIETGHSTVTTEKEIVQQLAEAFQKTSALSNYTPEFQNIRKEAEKININFTSDNLEPYNTILSAEELNLAISNSHNTAAGPDSIHNQMIKNLPQTSKNLLLNIFNRIWTDGKIPNTWKEATVIPIPKPGKDHSQATNYRPIALTSCLCKTLERIINNRLTWHLENNHVLNENQSGFRKNRSTLDNMIKLESFVRDAFRRKEHAIVIFFDVEKAYDTTWRYGILQDLYRAGLRGRLPVIIQDFLSDRRFRVKINETISGKHTQETGVPQGSILSVTLFNIKMNGVAGVLTPRTFCSMYVDDLCVGFKSKDMTYIMQQAKTNIEQILQWTTKNGFKISKEKTTGIHFCKRRGLHPDPEILIDGTPIRFQKEVKFLGVTLDQKLSFIPHIQAVRKEGHQRLNIIRTLASTTWGADTSTLMHLYRAKVRSKLDYGCSLYGAARKTYLKNLNYIHHEGLRLITGAFRTSPVQSMYIESREPPLHLRHLKLALQYIIKLRRNPKNPAYTVVFSPTRTSVALPEVKNAIQTLGKRLAHHIENMNINLNNVIQYHRPLIPPWNIRRPHIITNLMVSNKQTTHPNEYQQIFASIKESFSQYNFIYTDGSRSEDRVTAAIVHKTNSYTADLLKESSIFTAEATAILMALEYIEDSRLTQTIICSDSKSCIQAIETTSQNHPIISNILAKFLHLTDIRYDIKLCWIPSHTGISGNEKADKATRKPPNTILQNTKIPATDFKPKIQSYIKELWQQEWEHQENNKLHEIAPAINNGPIIHLRNKKDQTIWTRCRIGHTKLTHQHLLKGEPPPTCDTCNKTITVKHIILECDKYKDTRIKQNISHDLQTALNPKNTSKLMTFLKDIGIKAQL